MRLKSGGFRFRNTIAITARESLIFHSGTKSGPCGNCVVRTVSVRGSKKRDCGLKAGTSPGQPRQLCERSRAGSFHQYGGTFTADKKMKVATIPVGYGDGYARGLSNRGEVLIRGKRARILGRVCMDQFMVDVTDIPDTVFMDEVVLIGRDGDDEITVEELSEICGRFNYEFVCCLGKRIPRVYKGSNLLEK